MKHYVCSDLHGQKALYEQLMSSVDDTEQYTLYYLGDAVDRGAYGYEIMKDLLDNPNVIYIKGNHEDLFVKSAKEFLWFVEKYAGGDVIKLLANYGNSVKSIMNHGDDMALHAFNGGESTMIGWILDGCPVEVLKKLESLPTHVAYKNYDMCHAGCRIAEYDANETDSMIWSREHFYEPWKDGRTLIFGHTPTPTLTSHLDEVAITTPYEFDNLKNGTGRKIDIDCGAFFTGNLAVYDLDKDDYMILSK